MLVCSLRGRSLPGCRLLRCTLLWCTVLLWCRLSWRRSLRWLRRGRALLSRWLLGGTWLDRRLLHRWLHRLWCHRLGRLNWLRGLRWWRGLSRRNLLGRLHRPWRCCRGGRLPGWRRTARAFWGTTIRGARDEIEFGRDAKHLVESGGQQVCTTAGLHGRASAVIIKADG